MLKDKKYKNIIEMVRGSQNKIKNMKYKLNETHKSNIYHKSSSNDIVWSVELNHTVVDVNLCDSISTSLHIS